MKKVADSGHHLVVSRKIRSMNSGKHKMVNWKGNNSQRNGDDEGNFEPKDNVNFSYSLYFTLKLSTKF